MSNFATVEKSYRAEGKSRVPISDDNKRVYVTLSKEVVEKLQEVADRDMRSLSSMTALMVVRGLEATEGKNGQGKKDQ